MSEPLSIRLLKPWGKHRAGEIVEVDALRAARLHEDGIAAQETIDAEVQRILRARPKRKA